MCKLFLRLKTEPFLNLENNPEHILKQIALPHNLINSILLYLLNLFIYSFIFPPFCNFFIF